MKFFSEIMDPVHGYIQFTDVEKSIIDTEPVQRLHRLKQLGTAYYTYPSAVHSRFSHVTGAMSLAGLAADRLCAAGYLEEDDIQILRLSALLHDLGHGPFSHSSERVLRQTTGLTHEDMGTRLISSTEVGDRISAAGFDKGTISKLAVGKSEYKGKLFPAKIIAGQVDVDKMDFLNRDSHFSGVPYGRVDHFRLIDGFSPVDDNLTINANALYALEQFIIARYEMFKAVYYHRTVRASEIMLDAILRAYATDLGFTKDMSNETYLELDDGSVWGRLRVLSGDSKSEKEKRDASELYKMMNRRELLKPCYEAVHHESNPQGRILEDARVLQALSESVSTRANVDASQVFIDTPTLPTMPLGPFDKGSADIMIYTEKTGEVERLSRLSPLANALSQYVALVRVYSLPSARRAVSEAASVVFKRELIAEKVSY